MKKVLTIIAITTCMSCSKDKFVEEHYSNGNIKSRIHMNSENYTDGLYEKFYENGEIKVKTVYTNGKLLDTIYSYHSNGVLASKGKQNNNLPIGWHSFYDEKGRLTIEKEILIIDQKSYLNQIKYYRPNGKIDSKKSSYLDLLVKDTLFLGGNIGEIIYHHDTLGYQQRYIHIIIDNQYSEKSVKKDTFLGKEYKNWFGIYNHKVGKKKISGKIQENLIFINKNSRSLESKYMLVRSTKYFEKDVFVKDSTVSNW